MRLTAVVCLFTHFIYIGPGYANECRQIMGRFNPDTLTYLIPESLVIKIADPHPTDRQILSWAHRAVSYLNAFHLHGAPVADRMQVGPVVLHRLADFDRGTQKLLKDLQRQSAHSFHKFGVEVGRWVVTLAGGEKRLSRLLKASDPTLIADSAEVLFELIADIPKPLIDSVRFYHTHPTNELWKGLLSAYDQSSLIELAQQFSRPKLNEGRAFPEFHVYALPTVPRNESLVSHFSLKLEPHQKIRYTVFE